MRSRIRFTSAARSSTSRGPDATTSWPKSPSATRRAAAASRYSGRIALPRSATASSTTMAARTIATTSSTALSVSEASFSSRSACARAAETSASNAASLVRSASKSALPVTMSGVTTGLPLAETCLMSGSAYRLRHVAACSMTVSRSAALGAGSAVTSPRRVAIVLVSVARPLVYGVRKSCWPLSA